MLFDLKFVGLIVLGSLTGLIVLESTCRRKFPDSVIRPSNAIDSLTTVSTKVWTWLGNQFARFTDIYYIIKEFFPYEDIRRLGVALWDLIRSPFKFLKGYIDYYSEAMTPLQYGLVSSAIVIGIIGLVIRWYWTPEWTLLVTGFFTSLPERFRGLKRD